MAPALQSGASTVSSHRLSDSPSVTSAASDSPAASLDGVPGGGVPASPASQDSAANPRHSSSPVGIPQGLSEGHAGESGGSSDASSPTAAAVAGAEGSSRSSEYHSSSPGDGVLPGRAWLQQEEPQTLQHHSLETPDGSPDRR